MEYNEQSDREEIYSRPVRAGKRTYFLDVKSTRGDDLYLTITESKKRFKDDGTFFFEKHKNFLNKEDFEKFTEGLNDAIQFIMDNNGGITSSPRPEISATTATSLEEVAETVMETETESESNNIDTWSNVDFDDLGDK
jgi:methionyl-tRNA synthetase